MLVEKPFTINAGEARALIAAAQAQGTFLMEAMWTRFLPHVIRIREIIASGRLGEIRSVIADHGQWFPKNPDHRIYAPVLGGGALLDLGIYVIGFFYPVVPKGQARIRVQISAAHERADLDRAIAAFSTAGKKLGVI